MACEEYCIILRNCPDHSSAYAYAYAYAEQLRENIQSPRINVCRTDKALDSITASFGLAHAEAGDNLESLLTRADDALHQARHKGRNQVHPESPEPALSA